MIPVTHTHKMATAQASIYEISPHTWYAKTQFCKQRARVLVSTTINNDLLSVHHSANVLSLNFIIISVQY